MSTNDRLSRQIRRTALTARFTGISTRERNARIRRMMKTISAPNHDAALATVWA
jgi:hypothetical protein